MKTDLPAEILGTMRTFGDSERSLFASEDPELFRDGELVGRYVLQEAMRAKVTQELVKLSK